MQLGRALGDDFFGVGTRNQFRADVFGCWVRTAAGRRGGLGCVGRRAGFGSGLVWIGDLEPAEGAWQGAASQAMASAAAPYAGWLGLAAARATTAAAQAKVAASAFEAARAATVHPALVAINRTRLVSLVTSNLLGLNAPAIAAVEADYEQMWAQDVTAMSGYHGGVSAAAAQLTSWQQALQSLPGLSGFNLGIGNIGTGNIGSGNTGNDNLGGGNNGPSSAGGSNGNVGLGNYGSFNIGAGNGSAALDTAGLQYPGA